MKLITLLLFSMLGTLACLGQGSSLQVSIGASMPVNQFKNRSAAMTGLSGTISFQQALKSRKYLGVNVLARIQSYQVNNAMLPAATGGSLYGTSIISSENWSTTSLMVGPMWSFKLNENIYFEPRALVGYTISQSPRIDAISATGAGVFVASSTGNSVSTLVGANFRFDAGKRVSIFLNLDSFYTQPMLQSTTTTVNPDNYLLNSATTQIFSLNASCGVGYRFQ